MQTKLDLYQNYKINDIKNYKIGKYKISKDNISKYQYSTILKKNYQYYNISN